MVLAGAALSSACSLGADDWPAEWLQTRATPLATGDRSCPSGGLLLHAGFDTNGNSVLDAREAQWRLPVCAGVVSVRLQRLPASWRCPSGAVQAVLGATGGSGDARPGSLREWCLGAFSAGDGGAVLAQGLARPDNGWIARIEAMAAAGRCAAPAVRLLSGVDANRNGVLDESEVSGVQEVCLPSPALAEADAGATDAHLPATAPIGQVMHFEGPAGRPWRLAQAPGQRINLDALDSGITGGWQGSGPRARWHALAPSADTRQLLVAGDQTLLHSRDRGHTWLPVGPAQRLAWRGVAMSADGRHLVAAAADDALYTSDDGGERWQRRSIGWGWGRVAMSDDGRRLLAVRHGQRLMRSPDGGEHWDTVGGSAAWENVALSGDGRVMAATRRDGALHLSLDGGDHWHAPAGAPQAETVAVSDDGATVVASDRRGGLYRSDDGGTTWRPVGPAALQAARITALARAARGPHWVAGDSQGTVWTSTDGDRHWQRESLGTPLAALAVGTEGLTRVALPRDGEVLSHARVTTPGEAGGLYLPNGQDLALRHLGTGIWTVVAGRGPALVR